MRIRITTPALLFDWRMKRGLTQRQAASIFRRERRAFQNLERGRLKKFPAEIDDLARLYDRDHRRTK